MRYEFPWPPKELSPNARVHWRVVAFEKAQYKGDCGWVIKATIAEHSPIPSLPPERRRFPLTPPVTAHVTFVVQDNRRRDTPNYQSMLKPLWDALVEMGVLEDDSHDKLKIAEPKWERGPEKKVIVELRSIS